MKYKPNIISYWLKSNFEFDKPIEILVDKFKENKVPDNTIRIVIIQEPKKNQWLINKINDRNNDN